MDKAIEAAWKAFEAAHVRGVDDGPLADDPMKAAIAAHEAASDTVQVKRSEIALAADGLRALENVFRSRSETLDRAAFEAPEEDRKAILDAVTRASNEAHRASRLHDKFATLALAAHEEKG